MCFREARKVKEESFLNTNDPNHCTRPPFLVQVRDCSCKMEIDFNYFGPNLKTWKHFQISSVESGNLSANAQGIFLVCGPSAHSQNDTIFGRV